MKTLKVTKWFLSLAFITSLVVSCVKYDLPETSNSSLNYMMVSEQAFISNLGPVNDTTNNLYVILQGVKYELTNNYGTFLQTGSEIRVCFYSRNSTIISPGQYVFADSSNIVPYTFNGASLNVGGGFIPINKGNITVTTNTSGYNINLKCGLSDGESFTAHYYGNLSNFDYYNH